MKKILMATLTAVSMLASTVSAQQVLRLSHNGAPGNQNRTRHYSLPSWLKRKPKVASKSKLADQHSMVMM